MFSCTRANLKYDTNTSRRIGRVYVLRSDFEQIRFQETKKEFPYTAAIVSINRCFLRELKQRRRRRQQERHKSNWFRLAKQQLCTCSTLFCTFFSLPSLHDYDVKLPISRFLKDVNAETTTFFSFPEHWLSLLEFTSRKNCQHLTKWSRWNKRDKVWSSVFSYPSRSLLLKLSNTSNPYDIIEQQS